MAAQFEYPRNSLLDFSPINQATQNYVAGAQAEAQGRRQQQQMTMDQEKFGLQKQAMEDERQKAFVNRSAGIAQMIIEDPDQNRAAAQWQRFRQSDKRWDQALSAAGVDPNDHQRAAQMIIAEARGYRDPLDRQLKEAQIAKLQREAATGDNPAAVREWQYYSRLPEAEREKYLTMKRADKYLDTGTALVRPSQANPAGPPTATIDKNVAEEARQKKVGAETGELQMGAPKAQAALTAADAKSDIVINTIAEAKSMIGNTTAGLGGAVLSNLPGTAARDLRSKIDTLKANAGFAELQAMRDNSPTGGALGQVAVQELAMLQATITSLEQAQTPEQLSKALDTYEKFTRESKVRRRQAFDATYGRAQQASPQGGGGAAVPSGSYVYDPATGQLRPR